MHVSNLILNNFVVNNQTCNALNRPLYGINLACCLPDLCLLTLHFQTTIRGIQITSDREKHKHICQRYNQQNNPVKPSL